VRLRWHPPRRTQPRHGALDSTEPRSSCRSTQAPAKDPWPSPDRNADGHSTGHRYLLMTANQPTRCTWASPDDPLMVDHHDREWGVPVHDDRKHFEFLLLEAAQAGLSWSTVLKKREGYRRAFSDFNPEAVARYTAKRLQKLVVDPAIVRNRMKIE